MSRAPGDPDPTPPPFIDACPRVPPPGAIYLVRPDIRA